MGRGGSGIAWSEDTDPSREVVGLSSSSSLSLPPSQTCNTNDVGKREGCENDVWVESSEARSDRPFNEQVV